MAAPRWEPSDVEDVRHALEEAGQIRGAAMRLGISETTLRTWARRTGFDLSPYRQPSGRSPAVQLSLDPEERRVTQRLQDEVTALRRQLRDADRRSNLYEDLIELARECWQPYAPSPLVPPPTHETETVEDAILAWADWHGGEVVDYDVMQGCNAYDLTLMCRRAQYTVDTTVDALFSWHRGTRFERLWVFDLGDSINGELRDEQKATNALGFMESCRLVAHIRARALTELSAYIPVCYVAVPGNHGRLGRTMEWKRPTENGDWLVAEMVGDLCRTNERVSCVSPRSWTAGVTIRGWNHALNHGTTVAKGGYGGISWYAIQRADGKLTALESAHGQHVHYRWLGHIHQRAEIPAMDGEGELFIVGSLKGGDEYALYGLNSYSAPRQQLVGVHDETGVSWRYPLLVQRGDSTPSRYEELL